MKPKQTTHVWRLAVLATLCVALSAARGASQDSTGLLPILNDSERFDTDGNEIRCQGGSMMKLGDTWYWYGIDIEATKKNDSPIYHSVRCYTSKDLSRWKFEHEVFTKHVPNRVDVLFNPKTKKYVLFTKEMNPNKDPGDKIEDGGSGVALCDTPTGDFVWKGRIKLPDSVGGGDQSVFIDDNGKAYITYAVWITRKEANRGMMIAELSDDYLTAVRTVAKNDTHLEAPAIFKRNGMYYWMASRIQWWYSSKTMYCMAPKIDGPWTDWTPLTAKDPRLAKDCDYDSYNAQHDFVVDVKGTQGEFFMFCGDRYHQFTKWGVGRVVWLPLGFEGDKPYLDWHRTWYVNAVKGIWTATSAQGENAK
jgi:beta-xylosidase